MNAHKVGLTTGLFLALVHISWAALVAAGLASQLISWILKLHFLIDHYTVQPFDATTAALLVGVAFVAGYVFGFIFASLWNLINR